MRVVGLEWATEGLVLAADRLLHDGYQSWSYTGVEPIPASLPDAAGTAPHGGDDEDLLGEIPGVSWWWTALVALPAGAVELVPPATGSSSTTTRPAGDDGPIDVPAHGVRLFRW